MAFSTNLTLIVGQGNGVVWALHGVSYCHNSRLEPGTIFNKFHTQSAKTIENTKHFKKLPPFPPYRYPVRLIFPRNMLSISVIYALLQRNIHIELLPLPSLGTRYHFQYLSHFIVYNH